VVSTAPERIIIGGGVLTSREALFGRIRTELVKSLNGYVEAEALESGLSAYVVPPALGQLSGALGALVLAERALTEFHERKRYHPIGVKGE
jgi:fructokinase